jgi:site-specific DNA recombinase
MPTQTEARPQAILYAAKSTEDVHDSIPAQLAECRGMANDEGFPVDGEYQDEAASAFKADRGPGLAAALEHVERIKGVLIVQHSDRLARGDGRTARHLAEIYFWALRRNVTLRSVQDDSTFTNPILAVALGERNAEDSRRKSLAVRAGLKRRQAVGKHSGARPYGYRHRDGELEKVEAEAAIVRRIFAEYAAGVTQLQITRTLRADGVPTVRGGEWHQGTVRAILANSVYVGRIGEAPGKHQAIIDEETWANVEQLRSAKARTGRGRPPKGQHLFRKGMLRCQCGEAMVPRTDPNRRTGPTETYYCYGRKQNPESCSMPPIRRELIDTAVYAYFENVGLDIEATRCQLAESRDRKLVEVRALLGAAEREAQKARERLDRVRRDYQDGKLAADDWAEQREQLTDEHLGAVAEVRRLGDQQQEVTEWGELRDVEADVLRKLSEVRKAIAGEISGPDDVAAVRAARSRLFSRFVVSPFDPRLWRNAGRRFAPMSVEHQSALLNANDFLIEVWVRTESLLRPGEREGYDENWHPILRREPLQQAENNYAKSLVT